MKKAGFTLLEVLMALAVAASMAMAVGSGLIYALQEEASGLRKTKAALLLQSIECAHVMDKVEDGLLAKRGNEWLFVEHEFEEGESKWQTWQISPRDRRSATWSVCFIYPD